MMVILRYPLVMTVTVCDIESMAQSKYFRFSHSKWWIFRSYVRLPEGMRSQTILMGFIYISPIFVSKTTKVDGPITTGGWDCG